jgi:hypothetical protein
MAHSGHVTERTFDNKFWDFLIFPGIPIALVFFGVCVLAS